MQSNIAVFNRIFRLVSNRIHTALRIVGYRVSVERKLCV